LSTCTNGYEVYADFEEEWWYYYLEHIATECGLDTGLSPHPCVEVLSSFLLCGYFLLSLFLLY
jgi:hypothetical protein